MNSIRRRRSSPRGSTAAIVLLVLAAICLIVGVLGGYFAMSGGQEIVRLAGLLGADDTPSLVSPGEKTLTLEPGLLVVAARQSDSIDGKTYSYTPSTSVRVTLKDSAGQDVHIETPKGNSAIPMGPNGGILHLVGFAEITSKGDYTVTSDGAETALRVRAFGGADKLAFERGLTGAVGGAFAGFCGCGGFLVFGIIGGILLIFGKKKTPTV